MGGLSFHLSRQSFNLVHREQPFLVHVTPCQHYQYDDRDDYDDTDDDDNGGIVWGRDKWSRGADLYFSLDNTKKDSQQTKYNNCMNSSLTKWMGVNDQVKAYLIMADTGLSDPYVILSNNLWPQIWNRN